MANRVTDRQVLIRLCIILGIICCLTVAFAATARTERVAVEVHDVARVFVHERGHYSFLVEMGTALVTHHIYIKKEDSPTPKDATIIADVPDSMAPWYRIERKVEYQAGQIFDMKDLGLEIHIHSAKELNGEAGVHESGANLSLEVQTKVIE